VSYFRSERVPNENVSPGMDGFNPPQDGVQEGNSDYIIAGGTAPFTRFNFDVLSPVFAPPDGVQAGFNGDYSGLTIVDDDAHPICRIHATPIHLPHRTGSFTTRMSSPPCTTYPTELESQVQAKLERTDRAEHMCSFKREQVQESSARPMKFD
jgi:hypothetical protein